MQARKAAAPAALLALLALPLAPAGAAAPAAGEPSDAEGIADCLVEHSTGAHEDAMRQVLLATLAGESAEDVKQRMTAFTDAVFQFGVSDCGMAMDDFTTEQGKRAVQLYGRRMSAKVMQDAFARMRQ